jgi:hypothetical protein
MNSSEDRSAPVAQTEPEHARAVLLALILVAAVANLNLAVANVALPSIGAAFDGIGEVPRGYMHVFVIPSEGSGVVLTQTRKPSLVLTTCAPKFSASHRLIVTAERIGPAAGPRT